uniref:Uncharacterized protein n=1 Tax=Parascaris univalens TaxID=6257 RepID=A0A915C9E2_PARUN
MVHIREDFIVALTYLKLQIVQYCELCKAVIVVIFLLAYTNVNIVATSIASSVWRFGCIVPIYFWFRLGIISSGHLSSFSTDMLSSVHYPSYLFTFRFNVPVVSECDRFVVVSFMRAHTFLCPLNSLIFFDCSNLRAAGYNLCCS